MVKKRPRGRSDADLGDDDVDERLQFGERPGSTYMWRDVVISAEQVAEEQQRYREAREQASATQWRQPASNRPLTVPTLQDLCLDMLAANIEHISSLVGLPDELANAILVRSMGRADSDSDNSITSGSTGAEIPPNRFYGSSSSSSSSSSSWGSPAVQASVIDLRSELASSPLLDLSNVMRVPKTLLQCNNISHVTHVSLRRCQLAMSGFTEDGLAAHLRTMANIQWLDLSDNGLGDSHVAALVRPGAWKIDHFVPGFHGSFLDVSSNHLTDAVITELIAAQIPYVHLSSNARLSVHAETNAHSAGFRVIRDALKVVQKLDGFLSPQQRNGPLTPQNALRIILNAPAVLPSNYTYAEKRLARPFLLQYLTPPQQQRRAAAAAPVTRPTASRWRHGKGFTIQRLHVSQSTRSFKKPSMPSVRAVSGPSPVLSSGAALTPAPPAGKRYLTAEELLQVPSSSQSDGRGDEDDNDSETDTDDDDDDDVGDEDASSQWPKLPSPKAPINPFRALKRPTKELSTKPVLFNEYNYLPQPKQPTVQAKVPDWALVHPGQKKLHSKQSAAPPPKPKQPPKPKHRVHTMEFFFPVVQNKKSQVDSSN